MIAAIGRETGSSGEDTVKLEAFLVLLRKVRVLAEPTTISHVGVRRSFAPSSSSVLMTDSQPSGLRGLPFSD
jgi:hypothetical protein